MNFSSAFVLLHLEQYINVPKDTNSSHQRRPEGIEKTSTTIFCE